MITTHALGWALVDSLWQNALAAAGLAALLAIIPVRAARTRYAVAIVTLALMLALPAATAVRLSEMSPWTDDVVTATSTVAPGPTWRAWRRGSASVGRCACWSRPSCRCPRSSGGCAR